jgi:threonine synthase
VLEAVRESGGVAVSVTDEEILDTWRQVSRTEGMLICPEGLTLTWKIHVFHSS